MILKLSLDILFTKVFMQNLVFTIRNMLISIFLHRVSGIICTNLTTVFMVVSYRPLQNFQVPEQRRRFILVPYSFNTLL